MLKVFLGINLIFKLYRKSSCDEQLLFCLRSVMSDSSLLGTGTILSRMFSQRCRFLLYDWFS